MATTAPMAGETGTSDESLGRNHREGDHFVETSVRHSRGRRCPAVDRADSTPPVLDHGYASGHVENDADRLPDQMYDGSRRIHACSLSPSTPGRQPFHPEFGWQTEEVTNEPGHHLDRRVDPTLGTVVHVVGHRQTRPNLPTNGDTRLCPFCPGGLEAPDAYDVRWFVNRWPAMPDDRCEVVLYAPDHDASLSTLEPSHVTSLVDLWAERSEALGARTDVEYVLIFENRGASVGATISHPHGQIYAYDHVPERLGRQRDPAPSTTDERMIDSDDHWISFVPFAPVFPTAVTIAPRAPRARLGELTSDERRSLAGMLIDTCRRLDALFDAPLPYMMWIDQRPFDGGSSDAVMTIQFVSPWRERDLPRYIAAAEVAAGEYFNPVVPEELAERLRGL